MHHPPRPPKIGVKPVLGQFGERAASICCRGRLGIDLGVACDVADHQAGGLHHGIRHLVERQLALLLQSGMTCGDSAIPDELAKHRAVKEKALCERFARARDEGDLPAHTVPVALASYIMAVSNGMCVQAASGASPADLHAIADMALASFAVSAKEPVPA